MKRTSIALAGLAAVALTCPVMAAENIILINHSDGTDPFWPVVVKGAEDAAALVGANLEYRHPNAVDAIEMAQIIRAAVALKPDGLIISILDPTVIGPEIRAAVDAGIPVVSMNSGGDVARDYGVLFHVGQPEYDAGMGAGMRSDATGVTHGLCVNPQAQNDAITQRCQGYADGLGDPLNMIDATNDPAEIRTRTAAALAADSSIDGVLATGPHVCTAVMDAISELGVEDRVQLGCFDVSADVVAGIKSGAVAYTIDQQQYLQGYMPVIGLDLYLKYGLLPGGDILSGPGFVTLENVAQVEELAGTIR